MMEVKIVGQNVESYSPKLVLFEAKNLILRTIYLLRYILYPNFTCNLNLILSMF